MGKATSRLTTGCFSAHGSTKVAQVQVVSQLPLKLVHLHLALWGILSLTGDYSCHRELFGGTLELNKG
jgi:hypothetical protein